MSDERKGIKIDGKINLEWMGEALKEYLESRKAPKNGEAPSHSFSTEPLVFKKYIETTIEEKIRAPLHCSYCDYTPCRCKKEEYDK